MQASNKLGAIECPVLHGVCDNNGSGQPRMLNGVKVSVSEEISSTVSPLLNMKRKTPNEFECRSGAKKRRISEREKIGIVKSTHVSRGLLGCENKGTCSTSLLLSGQDERLSESCVTREFCRFFKFNNPKDCVLPELGKIIKKKKNGSETGNPQYTRMHCEINQKEFVINLLNSTPESKLRELGYRMESHPYPNKTIKLKNNEDCYFIAKTKSSIIKFGLIESVDGSTKKQALVVIKKKTLKNPSTLKPDCFKTFCTDFKNEVCLQIKASAVHVAPSVLGIAVTEAEDKSLKVYLAMELVKGSLLGYKIYHQPFESPALTMVRKINIGRELARQLQCLHQQSIYHGDLKSGNIIIDNNKQDDSDNESWKVTIIDFGASANMKDSVSVYYNPSTITDYFAPEVYFKAIKSLGTLQTNEPKEERNIQFPEKSDIYSLGFIFVQLLGDKPENVLCYRYAGYSKFERSFKDVFNSHRDMTLDNACIPSDDMNNLVLSMMNGYPQGRPTLTEIIEKLDLALTKLVSDQ